MKVLIVEDHLPLRRVIRRVIGAWADEVCECGDGAAACALYANWHPDWVLMDIELPQLNGIAATRQICANYPDARIVIVTNYNDPTLQAAATQAGARGYVLKDNLLDLQYWLQPRGC